MVRGTVVQFERYAVHDGPGIRTVVYLKGCPLRCLWCHSPETQSPNPEVALRGDRCIRCGTCLATCTHDAVVEAETGYDVSRDVCQLCSECAVVCPTGARDLVGRDMTAAEVVDEIEKDVVFYDQSGGGVTFSGGEPLMPPDFLEALVRSCRARRLHTAGETCGLGDPAALDRIAAHTDLPLRSQADGRRSAPARDRSVESRYSRESGAPGGAGRQHRVRFPLVPGVNDDERNVSALGEFVSSTGLNSVDILPYHRAGIAKYHRLGLEYPLPQVAQPTNGTLAAAASAWRASV